MVEHEIPVVAIELVHGERWTFFEDGCYGLSKSLTLGELQRAVAEMTVHARTRAGRVAA